MSYPHLFLLPSLFPASQTDPHIPVASRLIQLSVPQCLTLNQIQHLRTANLPLSYLVNSTTIQPFIQARNPSHYSRFLLPPIPNIWRRDMCQSFLSLSIALRCWVWAINPRGDS